MNLEEIYRAERVGTTFGCLLLLETIMVILTTLLSRRWEALFLEIFVLPGAVFIVDKLDKWEQSRRNRTN